jgi:hypothetical protein
VKPFLSFYHERNIINLIETIDIEGIGSIQAMADSGNSAYNVLDGRDLEVNNKKVRFVTTEKSLQIEKDIIDTIVIHIGSGVNENRPVVHFNIIFKGKKYNNVKFSVADRSKNETPVLLGRDFLSSLNALINVA